MILFQRWLRHLAYGSICLLVNAHGLSAAEDEVRILALGDSLTAGYGLTKGNGFTDRLQAALVADGSAVRVINAGVSGDTTSGGLSRLAWALADEPDAVILELGANDGLRGIDPALTEKNLDEILARLADVGVPVLLAGMLAPPNLGREYGDQFNAIFPTLAKRYDNVILYPFFLEGVAAKPKLNQDDGIHPNADGVSEIVRRILPHVRTLIERSGRGNDA